MLAKWGNDSELSKELTVVQLDVCVWGCWGKTEKKWRAGVFERG